MTRKNFKAADPRTSATTGATEFELSAILLSDDGDGRCVAESAKTRIEVGLISASWFADVNDNVCNATLLDSTSLSKAVRLILRLAALNARLVAAAADDCSL